MFIPASSPEVAAKLITTDVLRWLRSCGYDAHEELQARAAEIFAEIFAEIIAEIFAEIGRAAGIDRRDHRRDGRAAGIDRRDIRRDRSGRPPQVLSPVKGGPAGVHNLNRLLKQQLNPRGGDGVSEGDKVIQLIYII